MQSLAPAGGHRAARLPGRALHDEGRSAAAGGQRPSDQHADLGATRPPTATSTSPARATACGSACATLLGREDLLATTEFKSNELRAKNRARAERAAEREASPSARLGELGRGAERRRRALRADLHDGRGVRRSAGAAPRRRGRGEPSAPRALQGARARRCKLSRTPASIADARRPRSASTPTRSCTSSATPRQRFRSVQREGAVVTLESTTERHRRDARTARSAG